MANRPDLDSEWKKPANWRGGDVFGFYFAPGDPRVWVPKRIVGLGWTLNFAHRTSWLWLFGLSVLPLGVLGFIIGYITCAVLQ